MLCRLHLQDSRRWSGRKPLGQIGGRLCRGSAAWPTPCCCWRCSPSSHKNLETSRRWLGCSRMGRGILERARLHAWFAGNNHSRQQQWCDPHFLLIASIDSATNLNCTMYLGFRGMKYYLVSIEGYVPSIIRDAWRQKYSWPNNYGAGF